MTTRPQFVELSRADCDALLARNNIGRIAFSYRDHVDIEPIHYVLQENWIYGRTAPGTKLRTLAHNRWLAFEVDEIQGLFDWKSVVVKGALYLLDRNGTNADAYAKALVAIRTLIPAAMEPDDPTPDRNVLFRIHADQVTGRASTLPA
jgi:nitroimidazol reductase NimA-like FMN-containing flavoprotein (pyridoxamine 5'-phosphate oxidase superfamily)